VGASDVVVVAAVAAAVAVVDVVAADAAGHSLTLAIHDQC